MGASPGGGTGTLDPIKLLKQHYPYLVLAAILGALIGGGSFVALRFLAPKYVASVTYEIGPKYGSVDQTTPDAEGRDDFERFVGTQTARMASELILMKAVNRPEVKRTKWAQQFIRNGTLQTPEAVSELQRTLVARAVPQTQLMELRFGWRIPSEAATIVSGVDQAYMDDLRDLTARRTVERRSALSAQSDRQGDNIRRLQVERDTLLSESSIETQRERDSTLLLRAQALTGRLVENTEAKASLESQLERYEEQVEAGDTIVYPDDLRLAAMQGPLVSRLDVELANLEANDRSLALRGYGEMHPQRRAIRAEIESRQQQRDQELQNVMRDLFNGQIETLSKELGALERQRVEAETELNEVKRERADLLRVLNAVQSLSDQIERAETVRDDTLRQIGNLDAIRGTQLAERVRVIEAARTPTRLAFPRLELFVPAGVLLMSGLVGGLIFLREMLDQRVRGPSDVSLIPKLRVVGVLPEASEDPTKVKAAETAFRDNPTGVLAESYRQLRTPVSKRMAQAGHRSLLVLPGMPRSGGTSVSANLALCCAAADERVLLIDANFRKPGVHAVFDLDAEPGLGEVLTGSHEAADVIKTGEGGVDVLPAGGRASRALPERLAGTSMRELLATLGEKYDRIIVDGPPAIISGDGEVLANQCDAVLLVVRANSEKRGLVARLRNRFEESSAEFLGVALNAVRPSAGGYFKRNIRAQHAYREDES